MKKTILYKEHVNKGAKIIPFSGFLMPVQYEGINVEHLHVRKNVGLFDVSLTVTDVFGCTNSLIYTDYINVIFKYPFYNYSSGR